MRLVPEFAVVLDANVLYPAPVRDILLRAAQVELFEPKWTNEIQQEWIRNLLLKRPDLKKDALERVQQAMDSAFPYANIKNYKSLIKKLTLPDRDDRHVVAAAIKAKATLIVTFNTRDFPVKYLKTHYIDVETPDAFIIRLIKLDKSKMAEAFRNQVNALKNPPQSTAEVLATLQKCGLNKSVLRLKTIVRK